MLLDAIDWAIQNPDKAAVYAGAASYPLKKAGCVLMAALRWAWSAAAGLTRGRPLDPSAVTLAEAIGRGIRTKRSTPFVDPVDAVRVGRLDVTADGYVYDDDGKAAYDCHTPAERRAFARAVRARLAELAAADREAARHAIAESVGAPASPAARCL